MKPFLRPRVWFNKTFSSIFNVLALLRATSSPVKAHVICSHTEPDFLGFEKSDEIYQEPRIEAREAYLEWCLHFCRFRQIDFFVPGKQLSAIVQHARLFEATGTRILAAADATQFDILSSKADFYETSSSSGFRVPAFEKVNEINNFERAYERLSGHGFTLCLKPNRSAGGSGFRILEKNKGDFRSLLAGDLNHLSPDLCRILLRSGEVFPDFLLMEYLPGPEYSVDCLADKGRLLRAVVRKKPGRPGGVQQLENSTPLYDFARILTQKHGLNFVFNIQFRMTRDGVPAVLEINPRFSGGIHIAALSGLNLPGWGLLLAMNPAKESQLPLTKTGIFVHQNFEAMFSTKSFRAGS